MEHTNLFIINKSEYKKEWYKGSVSLQYVESILEAREI